MDINSVNKSQAWAVPFGENTQTAIKTINKDKIWKLFIGKSTTE